MFFNFLTVVLACCACVRAQLQPTETYAHNAELRSGNIKLYWNFNDTHITFEVHGQTEGWIGIGFSPNGAMTGSDIIVGWVKDGHAYVTDRHGVGNTFPPKDPEQNIDVLAGKECDGWTMFKFTRQLAACETDKDREITSSTQRLIYAYGDTDPTGDDITPANYHGTTNRGVESMYFLEPTGNTVTAEENTEHFEILNDKFQVPAEETYYNCRIHKIPTLPGKRHVIRFEPVIQAGNEMNVHHILVYQCGDVLQNPSELNNDTRCFISNMEHFITCTTIIVGWAIGGGNFVFPKEAGLSLGGNGDPIYVHTETHYDNPNKRADIIDSSGIRFIYTSTLRKYDAGVVQIGNLVSPLSHFIPPRAQSFLNVAYCPQTCLENRMNASNVDRVNIFATVMHSHLAGRDLRLRHFRNDKELPHIAFDDAYDFNYQESRILDPAVELIGATDYTRMECVYNTEDRTEMMEGGLGTSEEMCMAFVFYYPRIQWAFCLSYPSNFQSYPYFGIYKVTKLDESKVPLYDSLSNYEVTALPAHSGKTVMEVMSSYNWTEENIDKFSIDVLNMTQITYCVASNQSETILELKHYPAIQSVYVPQSKQCRSPTGSTLKQTTKTDTCDAASAITSNLFLIVTIHVFTNKFIA